ncbi:MAG TPA: hypothetical protein VE953_11700 [Terriglobales bacterium]|nr:hypothetical protein [Terriglobales bacterium]
MTGGQPAAVRPWPTWRQLVSSLPVGIAVVLFVSIHWPWDLVVVGGLVVYIGLLMGLARRNRHPGHLRQMLLFFGFVFLALFTILAAYAAMALPQPWLPLPVVGALAAVTVVLGVLVVWAPTD